MNEEDQPSRPGQDADELGALIAVLSFAFLFLLCAIVLITRIV